MLRPCPAGCSAVLSGSLRPLLYSSNPIPTSKAPTHTRDFSSLSLATEALCKPSACPPFQHSAPALPPFSTPQAWHSARHTGRYAVGVNTDDHRASRGQDLMSLRPKVRSFATQCLAFPLGIHHHLHLRTGFPRFFAQWPMRNYSLFQVSVVIPPQSDNSREDKLNVSWLRRG